ncbi:NAD-dependent epimerase/dehydratase family protein [Jatrophihabitans telluris]|uniref:NAD-dependent epimerase/dehydratase family protein n=1 Tax=Jatrophihabitans telluris TaxID=2038343 RepID=A0ABY4QXI5_9ACTN|nr:NAD-dependent epimerase/dehydratase family protein [Jatrophihabitans telluris]UQX88309.1 NAD-dependent epimerase/dehydratase family protein [Jatrophihabitans telluris]
MDVLVLGGTVFLSRAMAETAVARGHTVTVFNRGRTGTPVDGVETVTGDRGIDTDLRQLAGRHFDLVFDTAYDPDHARASATVLEPTAGHYAYVSSINAYPGWPEDVDYHSRAEWDAPADADEPAGLEPNEVYGWRKVKAENTVRRIFGQARVTALRAGCIVGPHDGVGRLPWWLHRVARGGEVLVPGRPTATLRLIDARDIAEFALLRAAGVFEVTGPADQISWDELLAGAKEVTGSDATFTWIDDVALAGKVEAWTEIPLWVPPAEAPSLWAHDTAQAEAAGLSTRPITQTLRDVWAWMQSVEGGWRPSARTPGLDAVKERELLAELARAADVAPAGVAPALSALRGPKRPG